MTSWHSYPKIFNVGHRMVQDIRNEDVLVEEKIDGSQFSFGIFDGYLRCKSKGVDLMVEAPEKMFALAVATVLSIKEQLHDGWTYRAEYLQKPKHNTLNYGRVPDKHLVVFDINDAEESYLGYTEKYEEAQRLGLECVRRLYEGPGSELTEAMIFECLGQESMFRGPNMEGVVIKNYKRYGIDGKCLMAKHVSEDFKEVHSKRWAEDNPSQGDIVQLVIQKYATENRWQKAVQHLQEQGKLDHSPKDIGPLIAEAREDTLKECEQEIKDMIWDWAKDKIQRGLTGGLPIWYKSQLLTQQFQPSLKDSTEAHVTSASPPLCLVPSDVPDVQPSQGNYF